MTQVTRFDYRVIMDLLITLDCARSLSVAIMLRYGEYAQIVDLSFNPFDYNDMLTARDSLQATELLRKHEDLPTGIDRHANAKAKFLEAEDACRASNQRIYGRNDHATQRFAASRKIMSCLGAFHASDWFELSGWGPGVTLSLRGRDATSYNKFLYNQESTVPLANLVGPLLDSQYPNWPVKIRHYEGNRVITVPKNAKTERTIAVEPSLNLFFQKGVGSLIRHRLRLSGIDLNDQQKNQFWAQYGSRTGDLATIDFSAASDTISFACVHDLFQESTWFKVMNTLRSPRGYIQQDDLLLEYEKFSSMGNGFTFELESLIFWGIAKACIPIDHPFHDMVSVYGDDVIIPVDFVEPFVELCSFYGFSVNPTKSYSSSYYRESCGKHYWNGVDITPVYLRRSLDKKRQKMIFHNQLVELSIRCVGDGFRDKRFRHIITLLSESSDVKNVVPLGFGDTGLITDFDSACPPFGRRYGRGWYVKASVFKAKTEFKDCEVLALVRTYDLWKRGLSTEDVVPLGNDILIPRAGRYRVLTTWTPDWRSLGPWI